MRISRQTSSCVNPVQTLEEVNPLWRDLWETFEKDSSQAQVDKRLLAFKYWGFDCVKSREEMRALLINNGC